MDVNKTFQDQMRVQFDNNTSSHFNFNLPDAMAKAAGTPTRSPFASIKSGIHKINNLTSLLNTDR